MRDIPFGNFIWGTLSKDPNASGFALSLNSS